MPDDVQLLREYLENDSQEAFQALVERHVRLVYSTARRVVNNAELAEEVTQTVFMILATKGRKLRGTLLAGWLHRTARFAALQALRVERRRERREETFAALAMGEDRELAGIEANLDEALNKLGEIDRNAIILRFLEEKGLREVGEALGISEDAARMRVNRAVTKLQASLGRGGVVVSSAALVSALSSASAAVPLPSGVVSSVIAIVGIKGSGIAAATMPLLVTETLKGMALAKIKTASAVAAMIVVLAVMTAIVANNHAAGKEPTLPEVWQVQGFSSYNISGATNRTVIAQATNGPVTWADANNFSITVTKRHWRMLLQHVSQTLPNSGTQLGDDGTNYIIFAPGSAGTSRQGGELMRYEDTASIYKSGSAYPLHHGLAVWLLFASNSAMTNAAGDIGDILGPPAQLKYAYERFDDPAKNSFGPSVVRIFAKVGTPEKRFKVLVAEVEVLESQRKDGYAIPRRAELRQVNQRPGKTAIKVMSVYQLSNISLVRNPSVSPWPPPITRLTSIQDLRHHLYRFEYVSSRWTTEEEALQLMRSGKVTMYPPQ